MFIFFRYTIIIFVFLLSCEQTFGQSWRKESKAAMALAKEGRILEAAEKYESAWKLKSSKTQFIEKAGEYYAIARDYKRAAEAYRSIRDDKDFPMARYFLARALKQDGQYTEANKEFSEFISTYNSKDKERLVAVVENELKGCELAQQQMKNNFRSNAQISRMSNLVNSGAAEFAPIPFADDILYFSSTIAGKAAIYRTQKANGNWSKSIVPNGIPTSITKNICNGSFSADGKRFFYTECSNDDEKALTATCKIFVIVRRGNEWSAPFKLSSIINVAGANVSQPFATQLGEKEILFFSSDAAGGSGNMDIWQASRSILNDELNFSNPINIAAINTPGEDITPYFDVADNALYFSSNGSVTMGGLDIFKTIYNPNSNSWAKPENIGLPYSSSADDYYFIKNKSKSSGFLVSNRIFGKEKNITTNEDVFEFSTQAKSLVVKGQLLQKENSAPMNAGRISLYEIMPNAQKRLLQTKNIATSDYEFTILPDKKYRLETEQKGFKTAVVEFTANNKESNTGSGYFQNIYVEKQDKPKETTISTYIEDKNPPTKPTSSTAVTTTVNNTTVKPTTTTSTNQPTKVTQPATTTAPTKVNTSTTAIAQPNPTTSTLPTTTVNNNPAKNSVNMQGTSVGVLPLYETVGVTGEKILTSAPKQQNIYYKIQLLAVKDFDINEARYRSVRDLGRIDTEYIIGKNLHRVLLADFFVYEDVERILTQAQQSREFKGAYIVKYKDGIRVGNGR